MTTIGTETKRRRRQLRFPGPLAAMILLASLLSLPGAAVADEGGRQAASTKAADTEATATRATAEKAKYRASRGTSSHHQARRHRTYRPSHRYYGYGYPYYTYYGPYYGRYHHYSGYGYGPYELGRRAYVNGQAMGALDLDVRPEKAEVYLDGKRLGVADNFDGFPEFLWLEEGTYDLVIYKQGYKTLARQVTIYPSVVIEIEDHMEAGEAVRPEDLASKETVNRDERHRRNQERAEVAERRRGVPRAVGRLQLDIQPADAAVYLDGHFLGIADELAGLSAGLVVEPGEHKLEVVRPGYATQRKTVEIPEEGNLEVDLRLEER